MTAIEELDRLGSIRVSTDRVDRFARDYDYWRLKQEIHRLRNDVNRESLLRQAAEAELASLFRTGSK